MQGPDDARADELLAAAHRRPGMLEALRAAYRGRHDVLDALHWRAHPSTTAPSGTPDPTIVRDALAREVFSREGERSPVVEARDPRTGATFRMRRNELELRRVDVELAEDAAALDAAIAAALEPRRRVDETAAAPDSPTLESPLPGPPSAEPSAIGSRLRRRIGAVVGISAGAALLIALAFAGGRATTADGSTATPATPRHSAPAAGTTAVGGLAAIHHLDEPPLPKDTPPIDLGFDIEPKTTRLLTLPGSGAIEVFGSRGTSNDVCVSAVLEDDTSATSCVAEAQFLAYGVQVRVTGTETVSAPDSHTPTGPAYWEVYWRADGAVSYSSNSPQFPAWNPP